MLIIFPDNTIISITGDSGHNNYENTPLNAIFFYILIHN